MPNKAQRQTNLRAEFAMLSQPNGALQNYSIPRRGWRSVRVLDTKCTVGINRTYCHSICEEKGLETLNFMLQENSPSWHCVE